MYDSVNLGYQLMDRLMLLVHLGLLICVFIELSSPAVKRHDKNLRKMNTEHMLGKLETANLMFHICVSFMLFGYYFAMLRSGGNSGTMVAIQRMILVTAVVMLAYGFVLLHWPGNKIATTVMGMVLGMMIIFVLLTKITGFGGYNSISTTFSPIAEVADVLLDSVMVSVLRYNFVPFLMFLMNVTAESTKTLIAVVVLSIGVDIGSEIALFSGLSTIKKLTNQAFSRQFNTNSVNNPISSKPRKTFRSTEPQLPQE